MLVLLAACAPTAPMRAHPILIEPVPDAVLGAQPSTAEIAFSARLDPDRSRLLVTDAEGTVVSEPSRVDTSDPRRLVAPLRGLAPGVYQLVWSSVQAGSTASLEGQARFRIEPGAPARPTIRLSSPQLDSGQPLSVEGQGFAPSTRVVVSIGDDADELAVTTSRADGSFVIAAVPVPDDLPLGEQPVLARDNQGAAAASLLRVHWGGWPPLRLTLTRMPGPVPGEVTVQVGGRNRSDYVLRDVRLILLLPAEARLVSANPPGREDNETVVWDPISNLERGPPEPRLAILRTDPRAAAEVRVWAEYGHMPEQNPIWGPLPGFFSNAVSQG